MIWIGVISWFVVNIYVSVAGVLAISFGALDLSSMFGQYAKPGQRIMGVAILLVIAALWYGWYINLPFAVSLK